ncbi:MAG: GspH/FimT family pseudopilin [Sterolibacteriaceae bacterium]|nr:GspH/FimT family pseudopilin [Sterolibacteriaceae bacterium]MBK9085446.1 GspH/FimT family pseudopilin [Sterolibacteriaceae bacterium]
MNSADADKLDVAATEVRNALRFARSEAMRRGQSVLVDAESSPGRVKLSAISCTSFGTPKVVNDPRTKLSFDLDVGGGPYSGGVGVTPQFMAGGTAYGGVIFDATGAAADTCQVTGMSSKGTPQAGSGILLSRGTRQAKIALDAATGRVSGP